MNSAIKRIEDFSWFGDVLRAAKEKDSTDIFILEDSPVRLGILKRYTPLEPVIKPSAVEIKDLYEATFSTLDDDGNDSNVNFSHNLRNGGIEYCFSVIDYGRFRVSLSRSEEGYGMSIRKLQYTIPSFDVLNKYGHLDGIKKLLNFQHTVPSGLILHTGITGSGKTTIIAAEIDMLVQRTDGTLLTFENPIEYMFTHAKAPKRQFEIGRHITSYEAGLRMSLRNDPSIMLIGEVRDDKEFQTMIDTAERGHLLFSTMHTSGAVNTLRFLDGMGSGQTVWRHQMASAITAIVYQKLIYKQDKGFFIVPEVLITNPTVKKKIAAGDWSGIEELLVGKQIDNGSISLGEAIQDLVERGMLLERERRELSSGMLKSDEKN